MVVPQRRPRLDVEREKNRRTSYCSDEHAQFLALAGYLQASTIESYDGIAGDVLTQSAYLTPALHALFEAGDWHAVAAAVLEGGGRAVSEAALAQLLRPEVAVTLSRERAIARVKREVQLHACRANPAGSFYFWNRTRREIALAPYALMRPVTMLAPFLDREVFDLLTALPASLLMDRRFHTDAIARAYPEVADLPYAEPTPATTRPRGQRRLAADLGVMAWRARQIVSPRRLAPGLLATLLSGSPSRLWHTGLLTCVAQIAEMRRT